MKWKVLLHVVPHEAQNDITCHIIGVICGPGTSCEIYLGLTRVRLLMTSRHDVMAFMLRIISRMFSLSL